MEEVSLNLCMSCISGHLPITEAKSQKSIPEYREPLVVKKWDRNVRYRVSTLRVVSVLRGTSADGFFLFDASTFLISLRISFAAGAGGEDVVLSFSTKLIQLKRGPQRYLLRSRLDHARFVR
jgi:hypothetical protein